MNTEELKSDHSPEEIRQRLEKFLMQEGPASPVSDAFLKEQMLNFTPRAQQVLRLAYEEAVRFHHEYIGPEHLLLGLLRLGYGVSGNVLLRKGIDLEIVRRKVEEMIGRGREREIAKPIPYSEHTNKVLACAAQQAAVLNHSYIGTEHLLLGIPGDENGPVGKILKDLGLDFQESRQEILRELKPFFPAPTWKIPTSLVRQSFLIFKTVFPKRPQPPFLHFLRFLL